MAEKRSAETSTEEPVCKKQAVYTILDEIKEILKVNIVKLRTDLYKNLKLEIDALKSLQKTSTKDEDKIENINRVMISIEKSKQHLEKWQIFYLLYKMYIMI